MSEPAAPTWRTTVRDRVLIAAIVFVAWAAAIEARLVWLQVYRHEALRAEAAALKDRKKILEPRRGDIVDRRGRTLAISVDAVSIWADPKKVEFPADLVDAVCWALGRCTAQERDLYVKRLSQRDKGFAYLRRQVTERESALVAAQQLPGIYTEAEPRRYYPNRELAGHVLGYLGLDHKGLAGIELSYNARIRGEPGRLFYEFDAKREVFNSHVEKPPVQGDLLELTIDSYLQHVAERELETGVAEHRAAGGSVIIMDPRTGEVLAMANSPTVNPNDWQSYPAERWMNSSIQGVYEPGSTFKVVTASAAMEEHLFSPTDWVDASAGVWRSGSRVVREASGHNYGVLSFADVLVKSSNVGAIKIGLGVGTERLNRYVRRFGFGQKLRVDLPGESPGLLSNPADWSQSTLASVSMGYEIGVTPLQMATAVSSVANGGVLVPPRLVRALEHEGTRTAMPPPDSRRSINRETAAELVTIMEQVVELGTATAAQIPGYTVAGKTGTAAKIVGKGYSKTDYHSSFVGFVPSRQPAFTILVVVDSPRAGKIYGGAVAAPVFQRIAEAALRYAGVAPTVDPAPPVLVRAAADEAAPAGLVHTAASASAPQVDVVAGPPTVPDVRGLGAREAARRLARIGLVARPTGDGVVIDQDPAPGTPLAPGRACRLWLYRVSPPLPPALPKQ